LLNVAVTVTTQRAYLAALRGDAEGTASFASRALAEIGEDDWVLRSVAQWNLGLAEWLRGRLAEAECALSSTSSQWREIGERGLGAVMRDHLGQVQRARGRLDAALGTYQRTLAITAPPGGPAMPGAGAAHVGLAEVAYERNELDTALRHVTEGIPLCRQFVYTPPLAAGLVTLAWIRQAQGDPAGAREAMGEAGRVAPSPAVTGLLNPVPAQRARLLLAQGEVAAAA
jgi:LuxR family maltose regulon positive regulatory protein